MCSATKIWTYSIFLLMVGWLVLPPPSFAQEPISQPTQATSQPSETPDFNREIYYKNKLEASYDMGFLPWNVPFIFDPLIGAKFVPYQGLPDYVLLPLKLSLRWHLYDPCGPSFLRGNTDFTLSTSWTVFLHGPESYYASVMTGFRYNFIQPNWRLVPYFDLIGGLGVTDAQQPEEVENHQPAIGQGQDFTFTFTMGTGVRYNFNPRYSVSLGVAYMHISNLYLSTPKYYNHGVNVVGPNVGFNVALPSWHDAVHTIREGIRIPLDSAASN